MTLTTQHIASEHVATLEETINLFESAIAHNTKMGRTVVPNDTVLVHSQQERADRLRDVLRSLEQTKEPK